MARFEEKAAWAMGCALPILEVARRRTHFHPVATYVDDFIAGGLLLWAAYAASRGLHNSKAYLCAAWGIVCGGLYYSFFGQLERGAERDISGLHSGTVVLIKGGLFAVAIISLALSIRRPTQSQSK